MASIGKDGPLLTLSSLIRWCSSTSVLSRKKTDEQTQSVVQAATRNMMIWAKMSGFAKGDGAGAYHLHTSGLSDVCSPENCTCHHA